MVSSSSSVHTRRKGRSEPKHRRAVDRVEWAEAKGGPLVVTEARTDTSGEPGPGTREAAAEGRKRAPGTVVAIGSSAGGYEATKEFFTGVPSDTGASFVVIPHLDPSHESHLAELLRRNTSMPVEEARDGTTVERDHVYVIAPNTTMIIEEGTLRLTERKPPKERITRVIDRFFRSVADAYGDAAVGVVLSGALTDGTDGVKAIKAAGGFALVQDPKTASFPEMPRSALKTGLVDVVGSPTELAQAIRDLHRESRRLPAPPEGDTTEDRDLEKVLERLLRGVHRATGADFRGYKRTTLVRRIHRRMIATKRTGMSEYADLVASSPAEAERLQNEILILVTSFFRDEETTAALGEEILPELLKENGFNDPLRIWVAGCSTGEEAYSMAILVTEYMEAHGLSAQLTVFATDLSATAIRTAREAVYPEATAEAVSPERLARFFEPHAGGYRIRKHIRSMCVFAEHNLVADPPFSNMDIASCRNLLIYMQPDLQRRALEALHYALKRDGFLLLGSAESMDRNKDLFSPIPSARNVLRKRDVPAAQVQGHMTTRLPLQGARGAGPPAGGQETERIEKEADKILLERYSPPGVVVDSAMKVMHFRGRMPGFVVHGTGPASLDLMRLVPDGLAVRIRQAVKAADERGESVRQGNVTFDHHGTAKMVSLEVIPLRQPGSRERYYLVTFSEMGRPGPRAPGPAKRGALAELFVGRSRKDLENQVRGLERELKEAREHLKHVMAGQEAAVEELRSVNEELISTNEELQSTNEELETTKEELQSTNEELTTLNEELYIRNKELQETNNDLVNLLQSVDLPVIMLDADLKLRRFTEASRKLFHLIHMDLGRPLLDLQANFDASDLGRDLAHVLAADESLERTVQVDGDDPWTLKIHPFRTLQGEVKGVVLVASRAEDE